MQNADCDGAEKRPLRRKCYENVAERDSEPQRQDLKGGKTDAEGGETYAAESIGDISIGLVG